LKESHYALKDAKEEILDHLAVQQLKSQGLKKESGYSKIICLVGPPGVGKSSFAHAVALATGRKFVKISLGGLKDESEIRGHRRTYIGALPGRPVQALCRSGVINPLFLLDEIDKVSSDYRGDPEAALLELLDPDQNTRFYDNFFEEELDFSKVMFVATANSVYSIPPTLRDRLDMIHLDPYTLQEKVVIAKDFLVSKVALKLGVPFSLVVFTEDAIKDIINFYTREAGVRELERMISRIFRKIIRKILLENQSSNLDKIHITVSQYQIEKTIGPRRFDETSSETSIVPSGLVNGLAVTEFGGDLIFIEIALISNYDGERARLTLTGKLGEVMRESAEVALNYIKSKSKILEIPKELFNYSVHIHIPEGGVPKEGPSAGIALVTALISVFKNIPVPRSVAMTGEITLRGLVFPVGGIPQKLVTAFNRRYIKKVYIPKDNVKDLVKLSSQVRQGLNIVPVSDYLEIYKDLFEGEDGRNNLTKNFQKKDNSKKSTKSEKKLY